MSYDYHRQRTLLEFNLLENEGLTCLHDDVNDSNADEAVKFQGEKIVFDQYAMVPAPVQAAIRGRL